MGQCPKLNEGLYLSLQGSLSMSADRPEFEAVPNSAVVLLLTIWLSSKPLNRQMSDTSPVNSTPPSE